MKNKNLVRLINEEISEFDFLGMTETQKEEDFARTVNSKDFQINLMNDLVNAHKNQNISNWDIDGRYSNIDDLEMDDYEVSFDYSAEFIYNYKGEKIPLYIQIEGDRVPLTKTGSYYPATRQQPEEYPEISSVDYQYADINLFTGEGDEINIDWIDNNDNLKEKVISGVIGYIPEF